MELSGAMFQWTIAARSRPQLMRTALDCALVDSVLCPDDIRPLRYAAPDYAETERLKRALLGLRSQRDPLYLTASELDLVFRWKLGAQYGRNKAARASNTESGYQALTRAAFSVREPDIDYEAELRLAILTSLRGVGVPVASAILALVEPERYCVIDFRGWRAVFATQRRSFDIRAYKQYLHAVRALAAPLGWSVQETDLAIWEYDRRRGRREV
jgi:hypothetical protein